MQQQPVYDDEISLVELWNALVERKWLVLGVWGIVLAAGSLYALLQPLQYQWRAVIEVGEPIETMQRAVERLRTEVEREGMTVDLSVARGSQRMVLESVAPLDRAEALVAWQRSLVTTLLEAHEVLFVQQRTQLEAEIAARERARAQLQRTALLISQQVEHLRSQQATDQADLMRALQLSQLLDRLITNEVQQLDWLPVDAEQRQRLGEMRPTTLVQPVQRSDAPVAPKRELIIALSLVLGGMLGMMAAFVANFLRAARQARMP